MAYPLATLFKGKRKVGHKAGIFGRVNINQLIPDYEDNALYVHAKVISGTDKRKNYDVEILFYDVTFLEKHGKFDTPTSGYTEVSDGTTEKFLAAIGPRVKVEVRCTCLDFYFTWMYPDEKKSALIDTYGPQYIRKTTWWPPRNPQNIPGICKHIGGTIAKLQRDGVIEK